MGGKLLVVAVIVLGTGFLVLGSQEVVEELTFINSKTENKNIKLMEKNPTKTGFHFVSRVIDGDTIELNTGEIVRYIGIDTPESVDSRKTIQCFGKEAADKNKSFVFGKYIRLERDVVDKDKYGRHLRYVYLENGTFINLRLVWTGYARAYTYPPNIKYKEEFIAAEIEAREQSIGLWNAC